MKVKGFEVEGLIRVDNARVYGLEESILASGYPMQIETYDMEVRDVLTNEILTDKDKKRAKHLGNAIPGSGHDCYLKGVILQFDMQVSEYIWRQWDRYHFNDYVSSQSKMHRILKLDIDETCNKYVSNYIIEELSQRINAYNNYDEFIELIKTGECKNRTSPRIITDTFEEWYNHEDNLFDYNEEYDLITYTLRNRKEIEITKENLFNIIIANCPCGIMLTARVTLNYLQLKSMINQRENHKMQEWRYLIDWFKQLPSNELYTK